MFFGLLRVTVNWTTGHWTFTPLAWQLPRRVIVRMFLERTPV